MIISSFKTIKEASEAQYKEKGSKFLAFAYPVSNEQEVKEKLTILRKKYFDASHHCYAYVLGTDSKTFRANDDGEPNHSAGDPILGQIKSNELSNVLVVVVRYFGGTKLGVGGLIQAYKSAAELVLNRAKIVDEEIKSIVQLNFNYDQTAEVMRLIKSFEAEIRTQKFASDCEIVISVNIQKENRLIEKITLLNNTGNSIFIKQLN